MPHIIPANLLAYNCHGKSINPNMHDMPQKYFSPCFDHAFMVEKKFLEGAIVSDLKSRTRFRGSETENLFLEDPPLHC